MNNEIYCDWASTALFDTEILEKAFKTSIEFGGNPSSVHQKGIDAKYALQNARKRCANSLGVKEENIIFTSGGTESNHIAILSLLTRPVKGSILVSSLEHPAIREQAEIMKKCGFQVYKIPSDENGIITPESVIKTMKDDTLLVCVMAVNNETGSVMPIYEISDALTKHCAGKKRPKFHVDAVQAAGKIPLDLSYKGIDFASISAHKIGGPRGIGILYTKDKFEPFLRGGGQENGLRSGTENLFGSEAISLCLEKYFI
jgi:cysteine desulfurase